MRAIFAIVCAVALSLPASATDTLWIFDADFHDLEGDNAGWTSYDRSGTLGQENYWHKDTLFTDAFPQLGDSAWWCGTYDECFEQGQGYGNNWYCTLERDFTIDWPGIQVTQAELEFDQRFAMEKDYDYGYVDIRSTATADRRAKA